MKSVAIMIALAFCIAANAAEKSADARQTESKQLALEGLRLWAAFHSAVFAEVAGEKDMQAKLFEIGLRAGRKFLAAVDAKKISQDDANSTVPTVVLLTAQGPTHDFILGRIWEIASQDAYDQFKVKDGVMGKEEMKMIAQRELRKANAELLSAP